VGWPVPIYADSGHASRQAEDSSSSAQADDLHYSPNAVNFTQTSSNTGRSAFAAQDDVAWVRSFITVRGGESLHPHMRCGRHPLPCAKRQRRCLRRWSPTIRSRRSRNRSRTEPARMSFHRNAITNRSICAARARCMPLAARFVHYLSGNGNLSSSQLVWRFRSPHHYRGESENADFW